MSKLKLVHLIVGGLTVLIFLFTGVYMRWNFPEIYGGNQATRMMFRASHIYILLAGLLNAALGSYFVFSAERWKQKLQIFGSVLILAATGLFIAAFFYEPFLGSIKRPLTLPAMIMLLAGMFGHFIGSVKTKDKAE